MERLLGPIDGYYAAIVARELDGKFHASYKVCAAAPVDYASAAALRHRRVGGPSDTLDEALDIAEQLARLQIARLRDEDQARTAQRPRSVLTVDFDTSIGDDTPTLGPAHMYAPTEPAPLYASNEAGHLHAATAPAPLRR